ncbi:MAG: hypothetical protein ACXAC0_06240 [Candidatus Thorarchaeota archaeon]
MYESKIHTHLQGLATKTMHVLDHHAALSPIMLQKTTPSLGPTRASSAICLVTLWVGPFTISF